MLTERQSHLSVVRPSAEAAELFADRNEGSARAYRLLSSLRYGHLPSDALAQIIAELGDRPHALDGFLKRIQQHLRKHPL